MKALHSRRQVLHSIAMGAAGSSGVAAKPAKTDAAESPVPPTSQPAGVCTLFPQADDGPYYFDPKLVRSDVTEARPGLPLQVALKVVERGPCIPIANARVDIWHADAGGIYSGYPGQGDARNISTEGAKYLRGTQFTDADGTVMFYTIYPGWYPGRTPHIHLKVFLDQKTVLTGQMYFPDALSERIYREQQPYATRPVADTTNGTDGLFKGAGREGGGTVLTVKEEPNLIVASLLIAVDRSGEAALKASGLFGFFKRMLGLE